MQLYFFNSDDYKPYIIFIVRVLDSDELDYIKDNLINIFELLIEDKLATKEDLLIFSLIKEYNKKIENIILPFSEKNYDKADYFNNDIIIKILRTENCMFFYDCSGDILLKKKCNLNLNFLVDKYL
jgi:hypothetical protein